MRHRKISTLRSSKPAERAAARMRSAASSTNSGSLPMTVQSPGRSPCAHAARRTAEVRRMICVAASFCMLAVSAAISCSLLRALESS
jgi:hypothetical protein